MSRPRGFKHSEETKRKIGEGRKGKKHSEESKKKMREAENSGRFQKGNKFGNRFKKGNKYRFKKGQNKRERNNNWQGGKYKTNGYVYILKPDHLFCSKDGYVMEHRLVIEEQIRRYLKPKEKGHHINNIHDDNRCENLMGFKNDVIHRRFHRNPQSINPKDIIFDGRRIGQSILV